MLRCSLGCLGRAAVARTDEAAVAVVLARYRAVHVDGDGTCGLTVVQHNTRVQPNRPTRRSAVIQPRVHSPRLALGRCGPKAATRSPAPTVPGSTGVTVRGSHDMWAPRAAAAASGQRSSISAHAASAEGSSSTGGRRQRVCGLAAIRPATAINGTQAQRVPPSPRCGAALAD